MNKLKQSWENICKDLDLQVNDEQCISVITFLKEQNHKAESIACYLTLHCGVYAYVPDVANKLIEYKICKK